MIFDRLYNRNPRRQYRFACLAASLACLYLLVAGRTTALLVSTLAHLPQIGADASSNSTEKEDAKGETERGETETIPAAVIVVQQRESHLVAERAADDIQIVRDLRFTPRAPAEAIHAFPGCSIALRAPPLGSASPRAPPIS